MQRIKLDQDIKPLSEFRANATACLQQVRETGRPIIITQHGKSSAVLIDVREYEQLIEKLELLQETISAESQIEQNLGVPHDAVSQQKEKLDDTELVASLKNGLEDIKKGDFTIV